MFKRFWESLNYWAEALGMDDPRGEYMFRLEERVAKLEREVEGLQIQSRAAPVEPALIPTQMAEIGGCFARFDLSGIVPSR